MQSGIAVYGRATWAAGATLTSALPAWNMP
jgi:hypothetical protein